MKAPSLSEFFRRHPVLLFITLILLALVAAASLQLEGLGAAAVLYEAF